MGTNSTTMNTQRLVVLLLCLLAVTTLAKYGYWKKKDKPVLGFHTETFPFRDLLRTVCSLDSNEDTFIAWNGTVYDIPNQERQSIIFKVSGFNVARCYQVNGLWYKSSREVMLYLDPVTGEVLNTWENPSGQTVPVVHVANPVVQFPLGTSTSGAEFTVAGDFSTFISNAAVFYPNPLYANPATRPYADYEQYSAQEFFQWNVLTKNLQQNWMFPVSDTINNVAVAWNRVSPYLPWMNMGDADGFLQTTANAYKVKNFDYLPEVLKNVLNTKIPLYKTAPPCVFKNPYAPYPNWASTTSWSYFGANFQAYLDGEEFPLPETTDTFTTCL